MPNELRRWANWSGLSASFGQVSSSPSHLGECILTQTTSCVMRSALMPFEPLGMLKRFQRPGRLGVLKSCMVSHRSTTAYGRNWFPNSSLRDLIWAGWSVGHAVPGDLGLRRPRWRWDVRSYSEHQRRALLAHRTQIPSESFLVSLPPELRRLAFATAYFVRLSPPCTLGEHELDLLDKLD